MKLYSISDEYINYLRTFECKVYDNKEDARKVTRKYLGIVLKINDFNYYVPMSSPKTSDYINNEIRKSIIPIIRIISHEEKNKKYSLKGTLRIGNMIPVPNSELIPYDVNAETNKNYQILIKKELTFIEKNESLIIKYAKVLYNQKLNNYNIPYLNSVVDFKMLEDKCKNYKK